MPALIFGKKICEQTLNNLRRGADWGRVAATTFPRLVSRLGSPIVDAELEVMDFKTRSALVPHLGRSIALEDRRIDRRLPGVEKDALPVRADDETDEG